MAPPITVDIMAILLCWKNIARGKPQQGDRCHRRAALALKPVRSERLRLDKANLAERKVNSEELRPDSRHCKSLVLRWHSPIAAA
jgi:hypothetical protein